MQPSDPEPTTTNPPRWFTRLPEFPHWLLWPFYFLIVYVLSAGPASWLHHHHPFPPAVDSIFRSFYFPLSWLYDSSPTCAAVLKWYLQVWGLP